MRKLKFILIMCISPVLTEVLYNPEWNSLSWSGWIGNMCLWVFAGVIVSLCLGSLKAGSLIVCGLAVAAGLLNWYLLQFKYDPFVPGDLYSLKTGFKVAGNFSYRLPLSKGLVVFGAAVSCGLACRYVKDEPFIKAGKRWVGPVCGFALLAVAVTVFYTVPVSGVFGFSIDLWDSETTYYKQGFLLSFLEFSQEMQVNRPKGYSRDAVKARLAEYGEECFQSGDTPENIIIIMNEAFSDLGGAVTTNEAVTPFWDSLRENTVRGNLYVSVFGYGTCNTEFEVLTGHSMANLPSGSMPYVQFPNGTRDAFPSVMAKAGFDTIAFHDYDPYTWNRPVVYSGMGFSSYLSAEDVQDPLYIRNYISDRSDFEELIEQTENKNGQKMFIFNVTMQNHSGYRTGLIDKDIHLTGEYEGVYDDADEYVSLLRNTDDAFQYLIEYYRGCSEKTLICMFGDHQPALDKGFYDAVKDGHQEEGPMSDYRVPYIIWGNFEMEEKEQDISANYLFPLIFSIADIKGDVYSAYLNALRKKVPIMHRQGYMGQDGNWYEHGDAYSPYFEDMKEYREIQYYFMFDK